MTIEFAAMLSWWWQFRGGCSHSNCAQHLLGPDGRTMAAHPCAPSSEYIKNDSLAMKLFSITTITVQFYCTHSTLPICHDPSPTPYNMSPSDVQIFPHATGAAAHVVAQHQDPQELVFYCGWVSFARLISWTNNR